MPPLYSRRFDYTVHDGVAECRLPRLIDDMHGKTALGEIYSDGDNGQNFLYNKLMKSLYFPLWHFDTVNRKSHNAQITRDGEVPLMG